MHEPRPIAEQRTSGGPSADCIAVALVFATTMAGAAGFFFLAVRPEPATPSASPAFPPPPPPPAIPAPLPAAPAAPGDPLGGAAVDPLAGPLPGDPLGEPPGAPVVSPGTEVWGSLDRDVIRRVIRRHIAEVQHCYETGLATNPTLAGRVLVQFIVGPSGAVQTASVAESDLHDAAVEQCIVTRVRTWMFPAPDGGGVVGVDYPFVFSSSP